MKPTDSLLLKGVLGSTAFGLANENSDKDYGGIFVAPTTAFLGLGSPQQSFQYKDPDTWYHEVGKYCQLALKCNPTLLDLLWLKSYNVRTKLGTELINLRNNFLSAPYVRNSYFGYAVSQLGRLNSDERPEKRAKNARHFLRLLNHGFSLFSTGTYSVELRDPEEYFAFGERAGAQQDKAYAREVLSRYETWFNLTNSVLPEKPNVEPVEAWLLKVRNEFYNYENQDFTYAMEKYAVWPLRSS